MTRALIDADVIVRADSYDWARECVQKLQEELFQAQKGRVYVDIIAGDEAWDDWQDAPKCVRLHAERRWSVPCSLRVLGETRREMEYALYTLTGGRAEIGRLHTGVEAVLANVEDIYDIITADGMAVDRLEFLRGNFVTTGRR